MTRITGLYRNKIYIFFIISRSILLKVKNILDKICIENQNKHLVFNIFSPLENRDVNEIMWKNILELDRPQMKILRMHIACWITKATNTLSEYVIIIVFPLQRWLYEHSSMLHHACLFIDPLHINIQPLLW